MCATMQLLGTQADFTRHTLHALVLPYGFDTFKKGTLKTIGTVSDTLVVNFDRQQSLIGTAFLRSFLTSM